MKEVEIEIDVVQVKAFTEKAEFRAPSLRAYRDRAVSQVDKAIGAVAEIDGKIEEVNEMLIRYQGKTNGKMVVMFLEGDGGYVRPYLSRYVKKEKVRDGEPKFRVERVKYQGGKSDKASLQRNTISLKGLPYSNDKCVKVLIDVAAKLIDERRKILSGLESRNMQCRSIEDKAANLLGEMGAKVRFAKTLVEMDFSDPVSAMREIERFKKARADDLRAAENDKILERLGMGPLSGASAEGSTP